MAGLAGDRESCGVWLPNRLVIAGGWFWEVAAVPDPGPGGAPACPACPVPHQGPQVLGETEAQHIAWGPGAYGLPCHCSLPEGS